jgi:hypothetical protein
MADTARTHDEWWQRFSNPEALQAWRAEQEQRQQVYRAQQEQLRLKRREQRRRVWRWVPVIVAAYTAVLLIVTALS